VNSLAETFDLSSVGDKPLIDRYFEAFPRFFLYAMSSARC